jgi:GPH family glycoside/pentoside/hexuronide:cation symporter/probable glucitol transport protein GutA
MVLANSAAFVKMNIMIYYVQYNLGRLDMVALFNLISLPGMVLGMLLVPLLTKKLEQKGACIFACAFGAVVNAVFFFIGYGNVTAVMVLYFLASFPLGVLMVLMSSMIVNTIEYAEWKTGQRREGLISSSQTFLAKLCMAIGGGVSGLILTISHYVPNQAQTPETLSTFHFAMTLLVAAGLAFGIIPMLFNDLTDKKYKEITAELAQRKAAAPAR